MKIELNKDEAVQIVPLEYTREVCEVVPCGLTESVGDIAALTVADYYFTRTQE